MHPTSQPHPNRPSGRRRYAVLTMLAVYVALLFAPVGSSQAAELPGVRVVGRWRPTTLPANYLPGNATQLATLYADPVARLLYAYNTSPGWLAAYDLDSLQPRGAGLSVSGFRTSTYVDAVSGTVFFAFADRTAGTSRIEQFGMRNGSPARLAALDTTAALKPGQEIVGMYRDPLRPVLWALSGRPQGGSLTGVRDIAVSEIEVPGADLGKATVRWSKSLPACEVAMNGSAPVPVGLGYVPEQKALYFGCGSYQLFRNSPVARGAARLPLGPSTASANASTPGELELFPIPGSFNNADAFFDPGSRRLVITTLAGGASVILFDTVTNSYVGSFAAGNNKIGQLGLDPVAGRFYGLSAEPDTGLIVSDVRATPARQGYGFPELAKADGQLPTTFEIATDPVRRRLILKYSGGVDFVVVEDNIPPYRPPEVDDPDRNTIDVPEQDGKTTALYAVGAQGYGSRRRQIGGLEALVINTGGIGNVAFPVGKGTRELRTAYLNSLTLTNGDAGASAITADRDRDNTAADASHGPSDDPWPYAPAHCIDFGTEPGDHAEGTTEVSCAAATGRVSAESVFEESDAGGVAVDRSTLKAVGRRDPKKGAVSTVTATARGVSVLGGVVEIGEVSATAEAVAKGRPGTAKATHQRVVKNVTVLGQRVCGAECNTEDVARAVNGRLVGRVRIDFPQPDAAGATGSDGGYQALIRRNPFEQLQEQLFNEQPPDRIEVPGMVITVYQDDAKPGRSITELAAVGVEARYGIAVLQDGFPGSGNIEEGSSGGADSFGDLATALSGGSPVFGLDPTSPLQLGRTIPRSPPQSLDGELASAGGILWNGLKRTLELLPVWAVLLLPVYLSARRWLLLQRDALVTGGSS